MAQSQLLAFACLALFASSAYAACSDDLTLAVNQSATLTSQKPRGCLTDKVLEDNSIPLTGGKACFDSVTIIRKAGANCNNFSVALLDGMTADCLEGPVGDGTLTPLRPGAGYSAAGAFVSGQNFTGSQSADNKTMIVSVDGFNCELTYTLKAANVTANATAAAAGNATALNATRGGETITPAASPSPTARSSVAAALPSAALLLLGAAVALAF